ncbi:MAG: sugar isomerase, partial [Saprospiraceae bacterium]|nr:sugar isomerase [Saprospiraceae bacterium]
MKIDQSQIASHNQQLLDRHRESFAFLQAQLDRKGVHAGEIVRKLSTLQIAIPSWALGAGGTRFGRFSTGGEPGNLEQKIEDISLLHALTNAAGAVSLHIPWDIPEDVAAIKETASSLGIAFDAVNSNTFQDQHGQAHS